MLSSRRRRVFSAISTIFLVGCARAQVQSTFFWGFTTLNGTTLPECAQIQIFVKASGTVAPQPPYTMFAYEGAEITTVQTLGSDIQNLFWTVDHAAGASLMLSMADAAGNAGGVGPNLLTVSSSGQTACHAQNPTSPISVTTNTTKTLQSCAVLPLLMKGGTPPYTITVATLGAAAVTNVTLGAQFDTYDWVSRASPGTTILASISDSRGTYAASTNLLTTFGSSDLNCGGLPSVASDSTGRAPSSTQGQIATTSTSSTSASASGTTIGSHSTSSTTSGGAIIGAAVGVSVLLAILALGAVFYVRWRRSRKDNDGSGRYESVGGYGMSKVNMAGDITPFVTTPNSYDTRAGLMQPQYASEQTVHASPQQQNDLPLTPYMDVHNTGSHRRTTASAGQSGYLMSPATASTSPALAYGTHTGANSPSVAPTTPSVYSIRDTFSEAQANYLQDAALLARQEAGPSGLGLGIHTAPPNVLPRPQKGDPPVPVTRGSVYQHADLEDEAEVELPPAYKDRSGGTP